MARQQVPVVALTFTTLWCHECAQKVNKSCFISNLMNDDGSLVYFMAFFIMMHYVANFLQMACSDGRSLPYGGY